MSDRIPFTYGEFYDFPRMIEFRFGDEWFLLRSAFDDEKDDYPDTYDVYLLPFRSEEEIKTSPDYWMEMSKAARLGQLRIAEVGLDDTRRRSIDAHAFEKWLSAHKK